MAQLSPITGILKHCGGMSTWKKPLLPLGKLSRPGRLVKALGHHTMQTMNHNHQEANENTDPKSSEIYRLANQFRGENTVVVGGRLVKNDAGEMSISKDSKQKAWLEHYRRLLNVEFNWDPDYLSDEPPIPITSDMVKKAIS